tara:strand:- start:1694 stop:2209 length:516 start_codon:yes stop_codon:yes gene_type:complete
MVYHKLPFHCKSTESLLAKAKSTSFWRDYFNFEAIRVRNRELEEDQFFANLHEHFPYKCAIVKLKPNHFYNWHVDARRNVCINLVLEPVNSHTIFCHNYGEILGEFEELKYEANTCYLFNNSIYHTVLNFESPRYLFSLEFDDKKLKFNDVYKKIINKEIKIHGCLPIGNS